MDEKYKRIETRSWETKYRGELGIHAAKKLTPEGAKLWADEQRDGCIPSYLGRFRDLPFGRLLCIVDLVACVPTEWLLYSHEDAASLLRTEYFHSNGFPTGEERYGNYTAGRWAWITRNAVSIGGKPKVIGRQGLFNVPLDGRP